MFFKKSRGTSSEIKIPLTSGNPAKQIVIFTLPILAGDFLNIFYTMADAFIIGRWLGIEGLAAVGVSVTILRLVYGITIGITAGAAVITAQRIGAGDNEGITRSVAAGLSLSFYISVILTVLLLILTRPLLLIMNTPAEIMNDAAGYVLVSVYGLVFFIFYNMLAGILRAGGDSFSPFIFIVIGNIINIILNLIFVVIFSWGIESIAAATIISKFVTVILAARHLMRNFKQFLPCKEQWIQGQRELGLHFSLGIAMALQRSIVEVGNILVQVALNSLGSLSIAAVSAAQRIRALNMMPLFSLSQAMTTYTAQNYGAGKMDRVYKGLFQASLISLGLGFFMAALNHFIGGYMVSLFLVDSPEAFNLARQYVLITGYTVFILGIMLVFRSSLQGLGMRRAPILCGLMETVMSIFAAFVLIPRLGFLAVCLVNPLSWLASGIPLYIAFGILKNKIRDTNNEHQL